MNDGAIRFDNDAFYAEPLVIEMLGVGLQTLRKARASGNLSYVRKGHAVLYRGDWVLKWLAVDEPADGCQE